MSVEFLCHNCGRELKVHDRAIGRKVRCPGCDSLVLVPDPAEFAGAAESAEEPVEKPDDEGFTPAAVIDPAIEKIIPSAARETSNWEATEFPENVTPPPRIAPEIIPVTAAVAQGRSAADASKASADEPPLVLPPQAHPEDLIDMTAMVDIVFFLLIFFMVTSLQSIEAVMNMPTPQSAEGGVSTSRSVADLENDPNYITVRIEDDDSIWVEDTQVFNDHELALRLRAARREADGPRSLLVIGDADASHGSAVRVFDAGADAGVNGISMIVQEKGESGR
jgi:biopolymer transport protein ExbD